MVEKVIEYIMISKKSIKKYFGEKIIKNQNYESWKSNRLYHDFKKSIKEV